MPARLASSPLRCGSASRGRTHGAVGRVGWSRIRKRGVKFIVAPALTALKRHEPRACTLAEEALETCRAEGGFDDERDAVVAWLAGAG